MLKLTMKGKELFSKYLLTSFFSVSAHVDIFNSIVRRYLILSVAIAEYRGISQIIE